MAADRDRNADVLIVGAGPSGLVLALWLARSGVRARIVDKAAEPGTTSRALAVQVRTLEFYQQLGVANDVVASGLKVAGVNLSITGRDVARIPLSGIGEGLTPFPFALIYPQDQHERFLIGQLSEAGVTVERGIELVGVDDDGTRVRARLARSDGGVETFESAWIVGCDGAHSAVRHALGFGFPGGTYTHVFYVADVQARGPMMDKELHVALDVADFLAVFPLAGEGRARLIGTVKDAGDDEQPRFTWEDVDKEFLARLRVDVERVNWFSTYRVHHRVTSQFRRARAFLAGDAAHIHSPVGGQGMNTGIGDAVNLAWKLAAVVRGDADARILDTYEPERIAFARRLVETTDRIFTLVTSEGELARLVRLHVVPHVVPALFHVDAVRRFLFRAVSQTAIEYRGGGLDEGRAGDIHGGDRLPWLAEIDNFTPLSSLDWQVHVYGEASGALATACEKRALPLHRFAWQPSFERSGVARDAAYLVRPDGYVALADAGADAATLNAYADKWRLRVRGYA